MVSRTVITGLQISLTSHCSPLQRSVTKGHPQMPRQSSASRSFAVRSSAERLRPPPGLTTVEKQIFIDLVANNKPEHFRPSDLPLLVAYTHACALEAALARQITANLRGSDSALIGRWERACKVMTALSMRLRLSPQSRSPTHPGRNPNGARASPPNYFDQMRLQNEDEA
jgi:hypothetical protein